MKSYLSKLELEFQTYGLIRLLGSSCTKLIFSPQIPRSWSFPKFHNFVGFILWLWRKWGGPTCENWSQGSRLMAWYVLWIQVALNYFLRSKSQISQLWHLKILSCLHKSSSYLHKALHETSSCFQILSHFWQGYECLFQENWKKTIKNLLFGAIPDT